MMSASFASWASASPALRKVCQDGAPVTDLGRISSRKPDGPPWYQRVTVTLPTVEPRSVAVPAHARRSASRDGPADVAGSPSPGLVWRISYRVLPGCTAVSDRASVARKVKSGIISLTCDDASVLMRCPHPF